MTADIVDLIMNDHREVERLFEELKSKPQLRPNLVPVLTTLLTAHSRAEEAEVYPAAKEEAGETEEVAHSQEEHAEADELLKQLAECDPESAKFDQVLDKLVESITHHVQEEESKVLPGMRERLDDKRRAELGEAFLASRLLHLGQQPHDTTREQMEQQARNKGVSGFSTMSKEKLAEELKPSS